MANIVIDPERCRGDGICVRGCPAEVYVQREKGARPEVVYGEFCIACGHCVALCPHGAIHHEAYPAGSVQPILKEGIPSYEQTLELVRSRRSTRAFRDQPVERELIEKVIAGARYAPSAHNTQSTEFIVIQDPARAETDQPADRRLPGEDHQAAEKPHYPVLHAIGRGEEGAGGDPCPGWLRTVDQGPPAGQGSDPPRGPGPDSVSRGSKHGLRRGQCQFGPPKCHA